MMRREDYRANNCFKTLSLFLMWCCVFLFAKLFTLNVFFISLFAIENISLRILSKLYSKNDFVKYFANYEFLIKYLTIAFILFRLNILFFLFRTMRKRDKPLSKTFIFIWFKSNWKKTTITASKILLSMFSNY